LLLTRALPLLVVLAAPSLALAQRETTREALARLEEVLELRIDDGVLMERDVLPALIVSTVPLYEESQNWFPTAAIASLMRVFKRSGLRVCEACMAPRTHVNGDRVDMSSGAVAIDDVARLDESLRGSSQPARTAIWLDENEGGVAIRIVDLRTSRILFAENIDPELSEDTRTKERFKEAQELERRARGDSITQTFLDATIYPGQHFSLDWTEQWGDTNQNLSGVSISLYDPIVGLGASYYRAIETFHALVGVKILMSVPTALVRAISNEDVDVIDPLLTGVFMLKVPFGSSNYGAVLSASTNGQVGIGLSLMNMSILPVLP
jgi:hypothetical protein